MGDVQFSDQRNTMPSKNVRMFFSSSAENVHLVLQRRQKQGHRHEYKSQQDHLSVLTCASAVIPATSFESDDAAVIWRRSARRSQREPRLEPRRV